MAAPHFRRLVSVNLIYILTILPSSMGVSQLKSNISNLTNRTLLLPENGVNELYSNLTGQLPTNEPLLASTVYTRNVINSSRIMLDNDIKYTGEGLRNPVNQAVTFSSNSNSSFNSTQPTPSGIHQDPTSEQQHESHLRILVIILSLGLFGVLILTLLSIYAVRFCFCGRRKHMMQRNLINDLSHNLQCTCTILDNCEPNTHSAGSILSGELPFWLLSENSHTMLDSSSDHWDHVNEAPEPQAIFPEYAMQVDTGNGNTPQQYMNHPPSYSELFGGQSTVASLSPNLGVAPSTSNEMDATAEPLTTTLQDGQNALLIKLNLNKTKVLSPENLIILSKLLDVPIMMQKESTFSEE